MAILRQQNWLSQGRVDLPHLRAIESAICADFDMLVGKALSGRQPLVLRGLTITTDDTVNNPAENLELNVASALIMHYGASESGTLFAISDTASSEVLNTTNTKVSGSFTASATHYIGLDLIRSADTTTSDLVQFLDVSTEAETAQTVPLARTLQYKIIISTQNFTTSSNIIPIAKVVTNSTNGVTSITDARKMMFRLGSGGDTPSALAAYEWGDRTENGITYSGSDDPFIGEDKSINNLKDWMDAMMTSVWEVKGGEHWYAPTNRDNVKLAYGTPVLVDNSDNFYFDGTDLKWRSLKLLFENSAVNSNTIADETTGVDFPDGSALYVDVDREAASTLIPVVVNMTLLGTSTIPGRRIVLAWRKGSLVYTRDRAYEAGRQYVVATTTTAGIVKLDRDAADPADPYVIPNTGGTITAVSGSGDVGLSVTGDGRTSNSVWGMFVTTASRTGAR